MVFTLILDVRGSPYYCLSRIMLKVSETIEKIILECYRSKNNAVLEPCWHSQQHLFLLLSNPFQHFSSLAPQSPSPRYLTLHGVLSPLVLFRPSEGLMHSKKAGVTCKSNGNRENENKLFLFLSKDSQCRFLQQQAASKVHAVTIIHLKNPTFL